MILACLLLSFFHVHLHFNEIDYQPVVYNDRYCQEHHHISSKECGECITKNEKYKNNYLFKSISDKHYSTLINHKTTNHVEFHIFYSNKNFLKNLKDLDMIFLYFESIDDINYSDKLH